MIRLFAVAFALALASSAQAMPLIPFNSRTGLSSKSAEHADRVCAALRMVLASGLPPDVPPAGAHVE